uniref:Phosphatidylinositol-specific phospholipase C X domain-containing protein n=1 Tax=Clastoptera arizonana TaxID=38151 RepID=A0A1B6DBC2_9HEMI
MINNLKNWMKALDENLKNIPLTQLAIPGTHDSMTYSITSSAPVSPDSEDIVKWLSKHFCLPKFLIHKWCITQKASIIHQLVKGIRYFDLRLATKPGDQEFYFVHGLYASTINDPLKELNHFLHENSEEVVILDFQHFYDFSSQDHRQLLQEVRNLFREKICPAPSNLSSITLKWMKEHNYQMLQNGNWFILI